MAAGSERYAAEALQAFVVSALERAGARSEAARLVAEGLVSADLRGIHTHGVLRTGIYVARLKHRSIDPNASLSTVRAAGAVALVDAGAGLGIATAARAMDMAVERARLHGVGVVGVRNSSHCGMLAYPALRAVASGMIGIALSNGDAQVAPWGARVKSLGTNPIAIAVPSKDEPPIVLDMATSVVPHSRIQAAAVREEPIPPGWAIDPEGHPTVNPHEALRGALLPFGGAKGSGLSIMVDILAGLLTGALSGPLITPLYEDLSRFQGLGHLFVAVSVEAFAPADVFTRRIDGLIREVRSLPPAEGHERVYLPGEIEYLRMVEYARQGIPLPEEATAEIGRVAVEIGVAVPEPLKTNPEPAHAEADLSCGQ